MLRALLTEPKITQEAFLDEWNSLSDREKEAAVGDIYGRRKNDRDKTDKSANENEAISRLDAELKTIQECDKFSYLEALRRCPDTAASRETKEQFLRCCDFNAKMAAARMIKYWEMMTELFGQDDAFSPVTLQHSLRRDKNEQNMGYLRLLPDTDSSGRGLLYVRPGCLKKGEYTLHGMLRFLWYLILSALEKQSVKENGLVLILSLGATTADKIDQEMATNVHMLLRECLPVRMCAIHWCHPPIFRWYVPVAIQVYRFIYRKHLRARMVVHVGSIEKVILQLEAYGIRRALLPKDMGGSVSFDEFEAWLSWRLHCEKDRKVLETKEEE